MNNLDEINNSQLIAICRGAAQRCDEQHGYMALASSDPHDWLPHQWVIDAMRDLLRINSEEVVELRAENKALTVDKERLDWLCSRYTYVTDGHTYHCPEGELVAYRWTVEEACGTVREAIDYRMSISSPENH